MKTKNRRTVLVIVMLAFTFVSNAQSDAWTSIKTYSGVSIYWRYRQELKDQYRSELKFTNNNSYDVEISFIPVFACSDGSDYRESGQSLSVIAGGTKAGEWEGLGYYVCKGLKPPRNGGYEKLYVKRVD
ncbi:MAG: hypothetical protein SH857_15445 [Chitinophagales bacterium]|nr:hypothetical protein [Chitinophagales bacterium]